MSVSYYSYAVIGCQIPLGKLFKEEVVEFVHRHTTLPDTNFCPICGEVVRKKEVVEIDLEDKLGVLELIWSTDQREAFIGYFVKADDGTPSRFMDISNTLQMKEDIKNILSPLGMWDEKKFSLYVVQYCSY